MSKVKKKSLNTFFLFFVVVLGLLLVSGCVGSDNPASVDFRTGKDGIVTKLYSPNLQYKIYEGSPFEMSFEVANKGSYSAPNGKIVLSGYDQEIISFDDSIADGTAIKILPIIYGKSESSYNGEIKFIDFKSSNGPILKYGDSYSTIIIADVCFEYETFATPVVCLLPDPSEIRRDKSCIPKNQNMDSQGAPVAVTMVEQESLPGIVNFLITVENVGNGDVISPGDENIHNCPFYLNEQNTDYIKAEVSIHGLTAPVCTPNEKIKLVNGKGKFICRFILNGETAYNSELEIKLSYNYHHSTTHNIDISKYQDSYE